MMEGVKKFDSCIESKIDEPELLKKLVVYNRGLI